MLRRPVAAAYAITLLILLLATVFAYRELLTYGPGGGMPDVPAATIAFIAVWIVTTIVALTCWMRAVR